MYIWRQWPLPFQQPLLLLGIPPHPFGNLSFIYLEIPPSSGANSSPLLPLVGSKLKPPPPPLSPSLTPTAPFVQCMPSQDNITISASHSPIHQPLASCRSVSLLSWRTSFFAHGGEYPSTLAPGLPTTSPPFGSSSTLSHPIDQVTIFTQRWTTAIFSLVRLRWSAIYK